MVRDYIQSHPNCTCRDIKLVTKIKIERLYSGLKEAYISANVPLSKSLKKRTKEQQRSDIINYIKNHPGYTVIDIRDSTKTNVPILFGTIMNAYRHAGVEFPKREITSGIRSPIVIERSLNYEKRIIKLLAKFGEVQPKVRTRLGIADCVFKKDDKSFVVEIKDFRARNNITMSQIKQLVRYMKALSCNHGLLVCPKESFPKQKNSRNIYIETLIIKILSEEDLRGRSINHLLEDEYNLV